MIFWQSDFVRRHGVRWQGGSRDTAFGRGKITLPSEFFRARESGGGPPHSKTLPRWRMALECREASWSAPALWRFWGGRKFFARTKAAWRSASRRSPSSAGFIDWLAVKPCAAFPTHQNSRLGWCAVPHGRRQSHKPSPTCHPASARPAFLSAQGCSPDL